MEKINFVDRKIEITFVDRKMEINFADRKMEKMEVEKTEKSAGCIAVEESKVELRKFLKSKLNYCCGR